jgi:hypothetical protein
MSKFGKSLKKIATQPWFATLKKVAPTIAGGLIGGPFGSLAVNVLSTVLGTVDSSDPGAVDQIAAQVGSGNPEILLKLKTAEQEFLIKMEELDIQEQDLYIADVQSARQMKSSTMDNTPTVLTYLSLVVFFGLVAMILMRGEWFSDNEFAQNLAFMLVGGALGWANQAFNFWLGSSRGSYDKSQAMQASIFATADAAATAAESGKK